MGNLTEAGAASVFKWQFTSDDDTDLGYIVGDISRHATTGQALPVVKMNNGKFALLLGNGQKSTTGKTVLFVVYVDGPSSGIWTEGVHYKKLRLMAVLVVGCLCPAGKILTVMERLTLHTQEI